MSDMDTIQKILTEHRGKWHNISTPSLPLFETPKVIIAPMARTARERHTKQGWKCVSHMLYTDPPLPSTQSCLKTGSSPRRRSERFPVLWHLFLFQSRTEKAWISCFLVKWIVWNGFLQEMTKSFVLLRSTESWICLRVIVTHRSRSSNNPPHPGFPRIDYIVWAALLLQPIYDFKHVC